jgi:RNA polymerase sigma-70 factor (ECF subfamily)
VTCAARVHDVSARTSGIDATEERLGEQARAGDAEAFGELVRRHQHAALRVATTVLGTTEGADDVVQQAIERAWRALATYQPDRPFGPWFFRIVANCARNDRRSRGRRAQLEVRATPGPAVLTPEDEVIADEDRRLVVAAMNRLASSDRLVIALRHFEGMNEIDMAATLDCRIGTVKSRLSRAMARLKAELEAEVRDA